MENNEKTRLEFFGNVEPCGGGYSIINGQKVHVNRMTELEAEGITETGGWFAAKKDFGVLKYNLTTALADADIAEEERKIPEERRIKRFIESHDTDSLYTVEHFSSWYRRMTGACMTGRNDFIRDNGLDPADECTVRFFLDLIHEKCVSTPALDRIRESYSDGQSILRKRVTQDETSNPSTAV